MIMGVETEFGMAGGASYGRAQAVQQKVAESMAFIPSKGSGVYLENGARVYVDAGSQNEYCTPETSDPSELVKHELAGREVMADAASRAGQSLLCSNVDPVYKTTWGTHENYSSKNKIDLPDLQMPLLVHLITRLPYTGAGGLFLSHSGVSMIMSPRACFIKGSRGGQGIDRRTLMFNKPNNYGSEYRNHLMSGESVLCHYSNYLKYATTALVVACLDAKLPVSSACFKRPLLQVMNQVNRDLDMQRRYELTDGRRFGVLDVQESLLDGIEKYLSQLPPWAPKAVERWHHALAGLRNGQHELTTQIDWMLYRHLLSELSSEMGMRGELLRSVMNADSATNSTRLSHADRHELHQYKESAKELYLRLHILGKGSLFAELEDEGWLNHRLPEISSEAVNVATILPPEGRASDRAFLIHQYKKEQGLEMTWNTLSDCKDQPTVDPVSGKKGSIEIKVKSCSVMSEQTSDMINAAKSCYYRGEYNKTIEILDRLTQVNDGRVARERAEMLCYSHARLGHKALTRQVLVDYPNNFVNPFHYCVSTLHCAVNFGLGINPEMIGSILDDCDSRLVIARQRVAEVDFCMFELEQNRALYMIHVGRLQEAEILCERLLVDRINQGRLRMLARTRCYLAKSLYLQGRPEDARAEIRRAAVIQAQEKLFGDLATYSYPLHARIVGDDANAREILRGAVSSQRKLANPLGLAQVLCIKARRLKTNDDKWEITKLRKHCDALKECTLAERIISNWDEWIEGSNSSEPDDYWGI